MSKQIHILSLSPAIDYILKFDNLNKNSTNRPTFTEMYPSGKGIHISMILNSLKTENESIIFTDGDFEKYFYSNLDKQGVKYKKFKANGNIRVNLKLIDDSQTECSATSPEIKTSELEKMKEYLINNSKSGDFIIVTGSIPKGVDTKIYGEIVELANSLNIKCVVDSFGEPLNYAITKKPFLIKPNLDELALTTQTKILCLKDVVYASKKLLNKGVQNILVSMGKEGAMFLNNDVIIKCNIGEWPNKLVNAAGAGDSMLGGFISEFIKTNDFTEALKMGIICGSATAFTNKIATHDLIEELSIKKNELLISINEEVLNQKN